MSGKKVKIPINKSENATQGDHAESQAAAVDAAQAPQAETGPGEEVEVEQQQHADEDLVLDLDGDESAGEEAAMLQRAGGKLDLSFLERDVDFSAPEGIDAEEFEQLKRLVAENQDKYLRALADMDNFRKRAQKERADLLKYQGEKILCDVVDVLDNLELALQHKDSGLETLRTGIEMIHKQFVDVLERWGVRSDPGVGKQFDPNKQNAINKVPAGNAEPGSVIAELKKTYFYKDKLLRVGEVVVADNSPSDSSVSAENGE